MGQGRCGDRPISAPWSPTCLTTHREEGLEVSEAGFRDDRLWAPIFLSWFHWAVRIPDSWSCPSSGASFSPWPAWVTPAGSTPFPLPSDPPAVGRLAIRPGTNLASVPNWEVSDRLFDLPGPPLPDLTTENNSPCLAR